MNDGSTDHTVAALVAIQRVNSELVIVDLSRNFGKEAALTAGLLHCSGQAIVPLDADLQDPPELIANMLIQWRNGAEVVLAVRSSRTSDTAFKRATANLFYDVLNKLSDITISPHAGDSRLRDLQVLRAARGQGRIEDGSHRGTRDRINGQSPLTSGFHSLMHIVPGQRKDAEGRPASLFGIGSITHYPLNQNGRVGADLGGRRITLCGVVLA